MGSNTYLKSVDSLGYEVQSYVTVAMTVDITGKPGSRVAVRSFGFTPGVTGTTATVIFALYFLQTKAATTIDGAVASGQGSVSLTSTAIGGSAVGSVGTLAANDYIVIKLDNGDYFFDLVASVATSLVTLTNTLTDTVADDNTVWGLGAAGDEGQVEFALTDSTQLTKSCDGGVIYAPEKDYPMMLYYLLATASTPASIDYLIVDYINV